MSHHFHESMRRARDEDPAPPPRERREEKDGSDVYVFVVTYHDECRGPGCTATRVVPDRVPDGTPAYLVRHLTQRGVFLCADCRANGEV